MNILMIRLLFRREFRKELPPRPNMCMNVASTKPDEHSSDSSAMGDSDRGGLNGCGTLPMKRMDAILHTMRNRRISLSALHALTNLYLNRPCKPTLSELAGNLGLTTAAVTSVADALETLGFASRFFDHRDRRRTRLSLTPRGHAFAEWISDSMGGRPDVKNVVPE
ncbi:MAG: MarR family transcriptional regulator [Verrucomicrobia bacterium]|nr:MarR family transcriptional regulator [Verrucomicrobiota bacterium]